MNNKKLRQLVEQMQPTGLVNNIETIDPRADFFDQIKNSEQIYKHQQKMILVRQLIEKPND
jgi:hypothetical protein